MLIATVAAGALVLGVPATVVVAGVVVSVLPPSWAVAAIGGLVLIGAVQHRIRRRTEQHSEGDVLRRISGRVVAGGTIRSTIADASMAGVPMRARRLARLGRPMSDVGAEVSSSLPVNGRAFKAICSFSEQAGASSAAALGVLADRADEVADLARQRKVALAQTKLSAVVVGVVPMAVSVLLIAARGIPDPGGAIIVVPMAIGLALQGVGTLVVFKVASSST